MCCLNNGLPHHFSFTKKEREKNCEVKHFLISNICRNNWSTAITISFKTNASHFQSNAHQSRKQLMYCCHEKTAKVEKSRYAAFKRLFRNKYWQHWPMALWRVFLFFFCVLVLYALNYWKVQFLLPLLNIHAQQKSPVNLRACPAAQVQYANESIHQTLF